MRTTPESPDLTHPHSTRRVPHRQPLRWEWPTLALFLACVAVLVLGVTVVPQVSVLLAIGVTAFALTLHSSLTHEICHGHPFPSRRASEALVWINPGLLVPYLRFRDTHLAHHQDAQLTDPYDDPETNYLDPAAWDRMPTWLQAVRRLNNTLAGRMAIGPIVGQLVFMAGDWKAMRAGDRQVMAGWLWHIPGAAACLWLVSISPMPVWAYLVACYLALSILKIRTFLEHQAHEKARGRTVVIEDRGVLAFLFLNNNFHVVHHMHPRVAWYRLPSLYRTNRERYLSRNDGYVYRSYGDIFRRYFWRSKDPVPHPLWRPEGDAG
ncbi:MAG: fatty acid desaturase [Pseudomonadota bacterium]